MFSESCAGRASDDLIHVDCVTHVYPDGTVGIHNMCFRVRPNEIVAVCGGNASGKSTLLEHLNGLLSPSSGKVYVMGEEITGARKKDIWRHVGLVFQRPDDQLFAPTVLDDVMFGPINMGSTLEEAKRAALEALESVGVEGIFEKVPAYLSGGQKRLVAIAGVLAMRPMVIAMDEPTSDLDPFHCGLIEKVIISMKERLGISVVLATHDVDLAARLADRACIIKKGRIIAEGPPRDIFYDRGLMSEAGLCIPKVAEIYLDHCARLNKKPTLKPLNVRELMEAMRGNTF
jgi:cobalt/nickel transport system ATP-binding protein